MTPKPTYEELEKENLRIKASVDELRTYQEKMPRHLWPPV